MVGRLPLLACGLVLGSALPSAASPVFVCVTAGDDTYYTQSDTFVRGLSGYMTETDYVLAHCGMNRMVRIRATDDSPPPHHARRVVLEMIANAHQETFQDVADRMAWQQYQAEVTAVEKDGCICAEDQ